MKTTKQQEVLTHPNRLPSNMHLPTFFNPTCTRLRGVRHHYPTSYRVSVGRFSTPTVWKAEWWGAVFPDPATLSVVLLRLSLRARRTDFPLLRLFRDGKIHLRDTNQGCNNYCMFAFTPKCYPGVRVLQGEVDQGGFD